MFFGHGANESPTDTVDTNWTTELETGIESLDKEHAKYFDFVNDLLTTAANAESSVSGVVDKIDFLIRYAMEHFSTEQNLMKQEAYDGYQPHFEEHMHFLKHVGSLRNQIRDNGSNDKLMREVRFYTLEWFVEHIQSSDVKFVEFLKQNPARSVNF